MYALSFLDIAYRKVCKKRLQLKLLLAEVREKWYY
jgi:hypothetical protein